jgi:flagellar basal-body rod protein FlgB
MPIDSIVNDSAMITAQRALDGLALQQQVIGRNIANVDTPGYQAQTVDFETALQRAQNTSGTLGLASTNSRHLGLADLAASSPAQLQPRAGGSERADGNNVNIDDELVSMSQTGVQYQAITELVSQKLALLKTLAGAH